MRSMILATTLAGLLVPAAASADSTVRYTNYAGRPLHLYYAVAPHGTDITCEDFVDGGVMAPDASWNHFVPSEHWTWIRLVEPAEGACGSEYFQALYSGDHYGYQATNIW